MTHGNGRYAPSPSGDLHLGNLRTAVLAETWARATGRGFRLRIDDIDAARSSETFLHGLQPKIHATTTVAALTSLLHDTDRHAARLDSLWQRARRESCTPDIS